MRVVVDTNVFISGLLKKHSYPAKILDAWILQKITPAVSRELINEYSVVLTRDKFKILGSVEKRLLIIQKLIELPWVLFIYPLETINVIKEDPADNKVLECATAANADFIVTGDQHLLELKKFRNIKILPPKDFIEKTL
ncbi:putative toxin-antitoxin system toxin component, PIN family [Carboxydothermus pertinax]|uniref:Nucleotide-binding protein n=1 Tax=Carboxydothermus pertinax TaxID=870242 RepID=A0A1L8CTG1_9THEO|nr:putative toxin-antitoxin system toxin component, PIN family [Carboxydothermus pertinax]GAV22216.1 nucleotide-binding protein [Carboxydothermus pertinax]